MTNPVVIEFDDLHDAAGLDLGVSSWMLVDQERINAFADVVEDFQWIHVNPERAEESSPYGGTIAHGYLTLASTGTRLGDLIRVVGASSIINYGVDRARFPAPLPTGTRIRTNGEITEVSEVTGGLQVRARVTTEGEGLSRPVCVAEVQIRYLR